MWNFPRRKGGSVFARDPYFAAVGTIFAHHQAQQCGFAGTGGSHKKNELALGDFEANFSEGHDAVVVDLRNILETDHETPFAESERTDRKSMFASPLFSAADAEC